MVTIFTPVYNRANVIGKLYNSLLRQTSKNFEWIVVDDGSTDELCQLVSEWKREADFNIIFKTTKNGGKHRAINIGVHIANGEFFFIVDSDDYISDDAVEFIEEKFGPLKDDERYAAISGLKATYSEKKISGGKPKFENNEFIDATNFERVKYELGGDKAEVYKTEIMRKYPFPEIEGELFLGEGVVWNKIASDGYTIRWFNKVIYYFEYQSDGLTRNIFKMFENNPVGWAKNIVMQNKNMYLDLLVKNRNYIIFFEVFYDKYSKDKMCSLLELNNEDYEVIEKLYCDLKNIFKNIILDNNIKTIAIYGFGIQGNRALRYFNKLGVDVKYIIDKKKDNINFVEKYDLDMELPKVDSVFISMNDIPEGLDEIIKQKIKDSYIWDKSMITSSMW